MTEAEFKRRTAGFALAAVRLFEALPRDHTALHLGRQFMRAATSVGANYRASCRGKSRRDVIAKLAIVEEEADECLFWLDLLGDIGILPLDQLKPLKREGSEILAMTVASIKTLRSRR